MKASTTSPVFMYEPLDPAAWRSLPEADQLKFIEIHKRFVAFTLMPVDQQKATLAATASKFGLKDLFSKWKDRRIGKLLKVDAIISGLTQFQILNPLITNDPATLAKYESLKGQAEKTAFVESLTSALFEATFAKEDFHQLVAETVVMPNTSGDGNASVVTPPEVNSPGIIKTNTDRLNNTPLTIVI